MLQRSLVAAALFALAAPLAAQDVTWSSDRPDGVAPAGVVGDRLVAPGALEFTYRYRKMDFEGVQVGTDVLDFFEVLDFYETAPFARSDRANELTASFGLDERLTLMGTVAWVDRTRDLANDEFFFNTSASGLSDIQVEGLFEAWAREAVRVHLHAGVQVPVGSTDERDDLLELQDQVLAYEMQPGTGSWSVIPGITAQIQNEYGTVGGQIRAYLRVNDNDRGYRMGDEVEGSMWAQYRLNEYFAVNSGVRFRSWGSISGLDAELDPLRDPGEDPVFSGGERADIPVGLNLYLPDGTFQGHRLSLEFVFPVHQDYDAVRLTGDSGFVLAWRKTF